MLYILTGHALYLTPALFQNLSLVINLKARWCLGVDPKEVSIPQKDIDIKRGYYKFFTQKGSNLLGQERKNFYWQRRLLVKIAG